jgi:hypothetical protein
MSSDQKRIFLQGSLNEPLAAGKVDIGIGLFDHPCWLLHFDRMVEEVA